MSGNNPIGTLIPIEEDDSDVVNAPYRLVVLKRRFPASNEKTIVRKLLISTVLTIVDSHAIKEESLRYQDSPFSLAYLFTSAMAASLPTWPLSRR